MLQSKVRLHASNKIVSLFLRSVLRVLEPEPDRLAEWRRPQLLPGDLKIHAVVRVVLRWLALVT